jgi:polysaccharide export outer membrane protein
MVLNRNSRLISAVLVSVVLVLGLIETSATVLAQQPVTAGAQIASPMPTPSPFMAARAAGPNEHYRIGSGDIIDVKVLNKPQFNREGVRVNPAGTIRMPLIKDDIRARCRTEAELEAVITELLKEYIRDPQVTVQIREYQSEPVAVLGAVRTPSRFLLQRRVRLLELLTFANGPLESAGRTIQIVHSDSLICKPDSDNSETSIEESGKLVDLYSLKDTLLGDEKSNPFVQPGDVVSIPAADQVYVIGNVVRPTIIALTETVTISRAIAMAGGTALDTKKDKIFIIRQIPGTTDKKEILIDLEAVNKHKAEDVVLVANDIIEVPASGGKRFFRTLMGAVIPTLATLPIYVIP